MQFLPIYLPWFFFSRIFNSGNVDTVDSRYLEVDGTTEIIRLTRSSTQRN